MTVIPSSKLAKLSNGLRIITEEIPVMRSVAVGLLVGAGSGNETKSEGGISHVIEHMSFKGTEKRSAHQIAHELDAVGGKINAYTSKEITMYYAMVLDKHIDTALDVLSDLLLNSKLDPAALEMEKKVVLEEINMYEDTPDELVHDLFFSKILHGHPLGKPTIGSKASVKSFTRNDLMNYRKKWYSPKNTIISLAGAIPKDVCQRVESYFCDWNGPAPTPPSSPHAIKGSLTLKKKKTEQVNLCLGVKGVTQVSEDRYPYALLDNILGGSMSSRLFAEIREKRGLAYSIYSTSAPFRDIGLAYVYAGTSKENLAKVVELVLEEYKKIKKEGVTPEELTKAKEYIKGTLVLGLESTAARMSWMAKSEYYYDRTMTIDEIFEKVDKVTRDDIIELANKYFRDEYLTLAVIGDLDKLPINEIHC